MLLLVALFALPCVIAVVAVTIALACRRRRGERFIAGGGALRWGTPILRPCPDCAELVLREAQVCKYCGCWLQVDLTKPEVEKPNPSA